MRHLAVAISAHVDGNCMTDVAASVVGVSGVIPSVP